ncbi:hypothetical protein R6Z07F_020463 [Ovis aries]|uniref:Uncharacterized protein n=1 Tax=Ovis ammon polii TaxID=230172 RepID=A0AAD4YBI6_OVIAM|nr:hypothetical protein MG293_005226 [Ovis ammon polii]
MISTTPTTTLCENRTTKVPKGPRVKATRNGKVPGAAERKLASPVAVVLGFRIRGNNQAGKFAFERRSPLGWEPRRPNRSPGRSRAPAAGFSPERRLRFPGHGSASYLFGFPRRPISRAPADPMGFGGFGNTSRENRMYGEI